MNDRPKLKIVLIEDNFIQRTLIRDLLKIIEGDECNLEIYTSSNGVEGLGYVFLTKPDIVIIDSTLPDYGGLELVDYLNNNLKKLEDITFLSVIVLAENEEAALLSPEFVTFNKKESDFLYRLIKFLEINISQANLKNNPNGKFTNNGVIQPPPLSKVLLFGAAKKVLRWSNKGDLLMNRIEKASYFSKKVLQIRWIFSQISTNLYLAFFKILKGKTNEIEENISQEKEDIRQFRIRTYPTLATLGASFLFVVFQICIFLAGGFAWLGGSSPVKAANITWDGGGNDISCGGNVGDGEKWSCAANWSGDTLPGVNDTVIFDGTSQKNSKIDSGFTTGIANLTINVPYNGTILVEANEFLISSSFSQASGGFNGGGATIDILGDFSLVGGTFTSTTDNLSVSGDFTYGAGSFETNGAGVISFVNGSATISCGNAVFNTIYINGQANTTKTVNSDCNLPLGSNPTINGMIFLHGILSGSGTLTTNHQINIQGNGNFNGFSGYIANGSFNMSTNAIPVDFSNYSFIDFNSAFNLNGGIFISTPANMSVAGNFLALSVGPVFNANSGTLIFDGGDATLNCGDVIFNKVTINGTPLTKKTVSPNCTLPLGNSPTVNGGVDLSGVLSGTGLLTVNDTLILKASTAALNGFNGFRLNNNLNSGAYFSIDTPANAVVNFGSYTTVDINGDFFIYSGSFTAPSGEMTISRHIYTEENTFIHNNGTVRFDGVNQIISGTTTYYNFTKTVSSPDSLTIAAILTKTITGTFTLKGAPGAILTVNATSDGAFGNSMIDPQGPRDVAYLSVRNNTNLNSTPISTAGLNITNAGNNINWDFNNPPNLPTGLGPSQLASASYTNNSTPNLQFNLSDPDISEQLKYIIEIDDNNDFSSPVVGYTSALGAQGPRSFSVGQDALGGTYAIGQSGQVLTQGNYYWRVRAVDPNNAMSAFVAANNGNIGFRLDTTPPTGTLVINEGSTTSTQNIMLQISAVDNMSGLGLMIISEDSDFTNAQYENYNTFKAFTLSPGNGLKTVYIKFKDTAGNESIKYSASITLDTPIVTPSPTPSPTSTPSPTPTNIPTQKPTNTPVPTRVTGRITTTPRPTNVAHSNTPLPTTTLPPSPTPTLTVTPTATLTSISTITPTPTTDAPALITDTENKTPPSQPILIKTIESIQIKAEESAPEFLKPIIKNVGTLGLVSLALIALAINIESILTFIRLILFGGLLIPFLSTYFSKRKHRGTIIDEFTKDGIGFATISVIEASTGKLVKKIITNWAGKYYLRLKPGNYRIEIYSSKYLFRAIEKEVTEEIIFAHTIELAKDSQKDIAEQLQFRPFQIDPITIALIGAMILAMLNLIYMRNIISMGILVGMVSGWVFFKLRVKRGKLTEKF